MSTGRRWTVPLRVRTYRTLASTLACTSRPIDSFEHLVGGRGTYPWTAWLRTPTGLVKVVVPTRRDAEEVTRAFHRHDYGSGAPQVVVEIGGRVGAGSVYFLSRSSAVRVHVWEPSSARLDVLQGNVAPFVDRCVIHPVALAVSSDRDTRVEGIGDALRRVLRTEDHIDLLKVDVKGVGDQLLAALPDDVLPDVREIVHCVPEGVRHHHPQGFAPDYRWRLAG